MKQSGVSCYDYWKKFIPTSQIYTMMTILANFVFVFVIL